jgi:signal transduction histidine kinase
VASGSAAIETLDELVGHERRLIALRWAGAALGASLIAAGWVWPRPGDSLPILAAGEILMIILAAGNALLAQRVRRAGTVDELRSVGRTSLLLDGVVLLAVVWLYSSSPNDTTWIVLFVLALEVGLREGIRGAVLVIALLWVTETAREVYLAQTFPGRGFVVVDLVFRCGVGSIIALVAGVTRRSMDQQAKRLVETARGETIAREKAAVQEAELRESFDALRDADAKRRRLLARLTDARDEERHRIAGDVHDDPLQKVVAAALRVDVLAKEPLSPHTLETVEALRDSLRLAIDSLRYLLFELRPPILKHDGLEAALRALVEHGEFTAKVEIMSELATEPAYEARLAAFRIAQEALANARKHANADRIDVVLTERDDGLLTRISDDGIGFSGDVLGAELEGHIGLAEMRERAEMAGGWCLVQSLAQIGTRVEFWIPSEVTSIPEAEVSLL